MWINDGTYPFPDVCLHARPAVAANDRVMGFIPPTMRTHFAYSGILWTLNLPLRHTAPLLQDVPYFFARRCRVEFHLTTNNKETVKHLFTLNLQAHSSVMLTGEHKVGSSSLDGAPLSLGGMCSLYTRSSLSSFGSIFFSCFCSNLLTSIKLS